jgi:hypothetical protein
MNRWRVTDRNGKGYFDHAEFTSFSKAKAWMRMFPPSWEFSIERILEKPPFDPLKAGWIPCPVCQNHESSFEGSFFSYRCPGCDGLGIVVGPPKDGLEIARMFAGRTDLGPLAPGSYGLALIRHANAYRTK